MSKRSGIHALAPHVALGFPSGSSVSRVYGAFELKRIYQKNMGLGLLLAAVLHGAIVGGVALRQYLQGQLATPVVVRPVIIDSWTQLEPPPSLTTVRPQVQVAEPLVAPPSIGIPMPVPDEEVSQEPRFPTRSELASMTTPMPREAAGEEPESVIVRPEAMEEEYFPTPVEFTAVDEIPVLIAGVEPVYPEIAALTGMEGVVWIELLIDREGLVRAAKILKPSGSNVGFEQAALDAAYKSKYKPAIQNGRPVAVRISHRVEFRFKSR